MNFEVYLEEFKKSADQLNKNLLESKKLEVAVGIVLDSVYLKLYKKDWANDVNNLLNAEARIFFSVWINDKTIKEQKIYYNIHALKLRKLKSYPILSREFADRFRKQFKKHQNNWKNVKGSYGPLTLMEGWIKLENENLDNTIFELANNFFEIDHLIDDLLKSFESS